MRFFSLPLAWVAWVTLTCLSVAGGVAQGQDVHELDLSPGASRSGTGFYTPEHWNLVRSTAINAGETERTPLLAISLEGDRDTQFTKRLWLPPRTKLTTLTPIRLAEMPPGANRGIEVFARLVVEGEGREVATQAEIGALPIRAGGFETGMLSGGEGDETTVVLAALRAAANLPPATAYLSEQDAPPLAAAWSNLDVLVISRESPNLSPAQTEAIRRWVVGGGRLWINLQEVDPDFAQRLLGDAWTVAVLDRIDVNDFALTWERSRGEQASLHVTRDYPIEFLRVAAPDMEVTHRVGGYPAAMWKAVGNGTLLVTTLEAPAWLDAQGKATPALSELTWLLRRDRTLVAEGDADATLLQEVATRQIGKSVMSRRPVFAVLGIFTLALLGSGLWLAQRGGLAQMAWVAPAMAVVAAGIVLGLGLAQQSEVPFTLAVSQRVEALPDEPYAHVDALVSVYTPPGAAGEGAHLHGSGPIAWPDLSNNSGGVRLVWTADGHWAFKGLELREGALQNAVVDAVAPLDAPAEAVVAFTESGVEGRIASGRLGAIEDPVIMTPTGKLSPTSVSEDGAFAADYVDPLGPDQFYPGAVLGQREMARQATYRQLTNDPTFPTRPVLVGWSDGLDLGVAVSDRAQRKSEALVVLPLRFERPAAGAEVSVPAAFFAMERFTEAGGVSGSPIFDERNRQWVPNVSQSQTVLMGFQPPEALRGIEPTGGRIVMELDTPNRPYEVVVYKSGRALPVASGDNANGLIVTDLAAPGLPEIQPDGSAVIGVRVGDPIDPTNNAPWSLSRLELSLTGRMTDPNQSAKGQAADE